MDKNHQNYNKHRENEKDARARNATSSNDPSHHAPGAGSSDRPDDEERDNQQRVPPRGQEKSGD